MKVLSELWGEVNKIADALDSLEQSVRKATRRETPKGRETPFWGAKRFVFDRGDFSPKSSPLVQSAGRVTRVTRVTYNVFVVREHSSNTVPPITLPGAFRRTRMRSSSRGMVAQVSLTGQYGGVTNANDYLNVASCFFDFEWTFSLGSSERKYAQRRDVAGGESGGGGPVYMSRNSLGNPDSDRQLLFSEQSPLTLKTNEFLTFTVRPTASYLALPGRSSFNNSQPDLWDGRFVVEIGFAGNRTFGYEA